MGAQRRPDGAGRGGRARDLPAGPVRPVRRAGAHRDTPPSRTRPAPRTPWQGSRTRSLRATLPSAAALAPADDPRAGDLLAAVVGNAEALHVEEFTARYVDDVGAVDPAGRWAAAVDLTWRFAGFDKEPVHEEVLVGFESTTAARSASRRSAVATGARRSGSAGRWRSAGPTRRWCWPTTAADADLAGRAGGGGRARRTRRAAALGRAGSWWRSRRPRRGWTRPWRPSRAATPTSPR